MSRVSNFPFSSFVSKYVHVPQIIDWKDSSNFETAASVSFPRFVPPFPIVALIQANSCRVPAMDCNSLYSWGCCSSTSQKKYSFAFSWRVLNSPLKNAFASSPILVTADESPSRLA